MSSLYVRDSEHRIEDLVFQVVEYLPTHGDPTTHQLKITDVAGNIVTVKLTREGFSLLKAILSEY